jgi:ubiquinone biosynthesis protein COQ9
MNVLCKFQFGTTVLRKSSLLLSSSKFWASGAAGTGSQVSRFFSTHNDEAHQNSYQSSQSNPNLRKDLLNAAIRNVPVLGWTQESIVKAALDLGLPPLTHRIIGRGPVELVEYFLEQKREFAKNRVAEERFRSSEGTHTASYQHSDSPPQEKETHSEPDANSTSYSANDEEFSNSSNGNTHYTSSTYSSSSSSPSSSSAARYPLLLAFLEAHVEYVLPYRSTWPSALATFAEPTQVSYAISAAMQAADDIVVLTEGKDAARMDWYAERLLAFGLHMHTELYMVADTSEDLKDTK